MSTSHRVSGRARAFRLLFIAVLLPAALLVIALRAAGQEAPAAENTPQLAGNAYGTVLPAEMSYQGQLVDGSGLPQVGSYEMEFGVYGPPPTYTLRYTEAQTVATDGDGLFNVMIGAVQPGLDMALAGGDAWLQVLVEGEVLAPLQPIGTVAYAQVAQRLVGGTGGGSVIAGGSANAANGNYSTVSGGLGNKIDSTNSTISGGENNVISGTASTGSTIGGGVLHDIDAAGGTIAGGRANAVNGEFGTIGGGYANVTDWFGSATIGGGYRNAAVYTYTTVSGGGYNTALGTAATVGGGEGNDADGPYATVSGGTLNQAEGAYATIAGGQDNYIFGASAAIGGGVQNEAWGLYAAIPGGYGNVAGGDFSFAGGAENSAAGDFSVVPGGEFNLAQGTHSFAAGTYAVALHDNSFVWSSAGSALTPFSSSAAEQFLVNAPGGVGLGTNTPQSQLHVVDSLNGSATNLDAHVATIENSGSGSSPDVLALVAGATDPGGQVNYVTFFDSSGAIAAIEGNGAGGVTYSTSGADFAEYLPLAGTMAGAPAPGTVLGLVDGGLTLKTAAAQRVFVVSSAAGFVGNASAAYGNDAMALVAFLGQVPVRVRGPVAAGDLLIASGLNDGTAMAVSPADLTPALATQIVGQALESRRGAGEGLVLTLVGQPADTAWAGLLAETQARLTETEAQLADLEARLAALEAALLNQEAADE